MIETRVFPARRAVAISAVVATATVMRVVFGMAPETVDGRTHECLVLMTAITRRFNMMAYERPAGRVMVEIRIFPTERRMAVAASRAHRLFVDVIVRMAVHAG